MNARLYQLAAEHDIHPRRPEYRSAPPAGPFIEIAVERWSAWSSEPGQDGP
jgi:hypothetical protein